MAYSLSVTEQAEEQLDKIILYLVYQLKNKKAAKALLDEIFLKYREASDNPEMFQLSEDEFLRSKGYHKMPVKNYVILYLVNEAEMQIYIMSIFHSLENYRNKL